LLQFCSASHLVLSPDGICAVKAHHEFRAGDQLNIEKHPLHNGCAVAKRPIVGAGKKMNRPHPLKLQDLAAALHGDLNGKWINIRGPGHGPRDRSLGVWFDPKAPHGFRVRSFAGDDAIECRAHVKALLQKIRTGALGPISGNTEPSVAARPPTDLALKIWAQAQLAKGTLAETYLQSRGIAIPVPASLRFHPALRHSSQETWPAMVGLVTCGRSGVPLAIVRTFLSPDGKGKAPINPPRKMLGPCSGGVVRLSPSASGLMVGEGIETCLSAMQATGRPAWAALSTSGLRSLDLPDSVHEVTVLADRDEPGEQAARDAGDRWSREGRRVKIARPPPGLDFNDLLVKR
jgi:putative DNA primase/helicase